MSKEHTFFGSLARARKGKKEIKMTVDLVFPKKNL